MESVALPPVLPRTFASGPEAPVEAGLLLPSSFPDARVLVLDDHVPNVMLLERMLESVGITQVHRMTDPRAVVEECLELRPDLVLLDLHMLHVDAVEVLTRLRWALPPDAFVPVIVLTADSTSAAKERALAAGAKDFLTKPLDRTEVLLRIRNLLQTGVLYERVWARNVELRNELDERTRTERAVAGEQRHHRERIENVLTVDALSMEFQRIADLGTGAIVGVEALARFAGVPRRPPNEWFAEAATVGLGLELELAAVSAALVQLHNLPSSCVLALNVSPATAVSSELRVCLDAVPGERIVLELTEHARVGDYPDFVARLDDLRDGGVRVAVDDAGAGYSGLQHILRLRPDIVKLDLDLTAGIETDPARRALAVSMVSFAAEIGAVLVAEGIETSAALNVLRSLGVACGQGFHLARPGPLPLRATRLSAIPESRRSGSRRMTAKPLTLTNRAETQLGEGAG